LNNFVLNTTIEIISGQFGLIHSDKKPLDLQVGSPNPADLGCAIQWQWLRTTIAHHQAHMLCAQKTLDKQCDLNKINLLSFPQRMIQETAVFGCALR
jgi:hypothetical protein